MRLKTKQQQKLSKIVNPLIVRLAGYPIMVKRCFKKENTKVMKSHEMESRGTS